MTTTLTTTTGGRLLLLLGTIISLFAADALGSEFVGQRKTNRYLAHIFNKYGSQGTIGFEGLEHLMHSLHLGGVDFGPTHTVQEHRPKDFKLPEIVLNVTAHSDCDPLNATDSAVVVDIPQPSRLLNSSGSSEEAASRNASGGRQKDEQQQQQQQQLDDGMWNNDLWLDAKFAQMHDPKHRHPRHHGQHQQQEQILDTCLTPIDLLHVVVGHRRQQVRSQRQRRHQHQSRPDSDADGTDFDEADDEADDDDDDNNHNRSVDNDRLAHTAITPDMFLEMCPLLLLQLDQKACAYDVHATPAPAQVVTWTGYGLAWLYASISILIISTCGLAGVAIVPLTKSGGYQDVLRFLVAVAVGTLCGDALMHLLPHALVPHHHADGDGDSAAPLPPTLFTNGDRAFEPVWLCFCAFATALGMFALETALPLLNEGGSASGHGHGHAHAHAHSHSPHSSPVVAVTVEMASPIVAAAANLDDQPKTGATAEADNMLSAPLAKKRSGRRQRQRLSPVAFMVLLGDGLHNITDGMAIGAAFAVDPVTGMATAFAVLCHELPHELGDFALLLQTGVSVRRALVFNVASSVLSVGGMALGLVVAGSSATMVRWIYAGTAGTFLYIALADLVPEMRTGGGQGGGRAVAVQVVGVLIGGLLMLWIALYEERLRALFE